MLAPSMSSRVANTGLFPIQSDLVAPDPIVALRRRLACADVLQHFPTSQEPSAIDAHVKLVFARLPQGVPFYQPKHVGPLLGITDNGFTKYCRASRHTRAWRGSYRFMCDDPGHMRILAELVKLVLWSGVQLPSELRQVRPGSNRVH